MRSRRLAVPAALIALTLALAACASGAAPSGSAAPTGTEPAPATTEASPAAPPTPGGAVDSAEAAAQLVIDSDNRFSGFGPRRDDMVGQCCWYEVEPAGEGYAVTMHAGWGDCPSGCIDNHEWVYEVTPDGEVTLLEESGDPVPPGGIPAEGAGG